MRRPTRRGRMQPIDRALAVLAGVTGVAAFVAAVLRHDVAPWALPCGVVMLLVGLVAFSLVTYQGPWR